MTTQGTHLQIIMNMITESQEQQVNLEALQSAWQFRVLSVKLDR